VINAQITTIPIMATMNIPSAIFSRRCSGGDSEDVDGNVLLEMVV
jgi:hypothetical protein